MIRHIDTLLTIDAASETHYRFHTCIDPAQYPQVHDFYELLLMLSGRMELTVNDQVFVLTGGALVLLRPGDVHSKRDLGGCCHINLAFPARTFDDLFCYLGQQQEKAWICQTANAPRVQLAPGETLLLQTRMRRLALLDPQCSGDVRSALRVLLLDCISTWFVPLAQTPHSPDCPPWLQELLPGLEDPAHLAQGMEYLMQASGRSKEHLCRCFRQYLGVTPGEYIGAKRLHYAANMLLHSDHSLLDIAYEAGFQSESRFYHCFKAEYGMAPGQYRSRSLGK